MLQYDFEQSVGYWLTRTTQAYHRAFGDELAPLGITYRQSQVLAWLALESKLSQSELASRMLIEPPTLVRILDRMESCGWIARQTCPQDRRKNWIVATPAAGPVWDQIAEVGKKMRTRATTGISPQQLTMLKELLDRVHQNVIAESPSSIEHHA
jgi:MarR family transcriptional regulator for hemolysin